jgi:hypothetical protein
MPGIPQVTQGGPKTYVPADNAFVRGGRVVEGVAGGRIQEAGAASVRWLGVALTDAIAPEDVNTTTTTDAQGRPVTPLLSLPTSVACAYSGTEVPVTYAADAAFGDPLICAANGTVTATGAAAAAAAQHVGKCTEPLGVTVATNPVGLMRIK